MISTNQKKMNHHHDLATKPGRSQRHNKLLKMIQPIAITLVTTLMVVHLHSLAPSIVHCLQNHHHHQRPTNSALGTSIPITELPTGDLCHSGWFHHNQKCYKFIYNPRTLESAKKRCNELSARLALIEDDTLNRDEELISSMHNTSLVSFLVENIKTDFKNRLFYVNISSDLMRQFKLNESNNRLTGDQAEHIDSDYTMSELWIPLDDKSINSIRYNQSEQGANSDSLPGFVLANSTKHDRWGLLPISPTLKAPTICERPAAVHDPSARHHARAHAIVPSHQPQSEHQLNGESPNPNRRIIDLLPTLSSTTGSSETRVRANDKEMGLTTTQVPLSPAEVVVPSALFRDLPQNQSVVMGSTSEMRCSPIEHDSKLHWSFNGRNLTQTNRIKLHTNGTLRIDHVRNTDGGVYTCTIHSNGIVEARSARLEILERPHQPEYITAELLDKLSTSVRVKWTPGFNGNSPITRYSVEMRTVTSDNFDNEPPGPTSQWELAKANISADLTSVIVADLKPARKYIFRIKADNRVGTSDPSSPTRPPIEVPVQPPSMAPENLTGTPRSATSISIQWSPPPADSQNGAITGYKIRHKLAGYAGDTDWYENELPEAAHLNFVLDDLITWQNYEIQVAAVNDKGAGPFTASVLVRTKEGKPDKGPRNVVAEAVSPNALKITWNPPPPQHINGINQGYKVQVWQDALYTKLIKEAVVQHNSLTPLQATTIDGLLPYTEYYVTVKCFTNAGDGVANEELVMQRTMMFLPEPVPMLEFYEVLDKSLRVVWKQPTRINGELSHYTLEYMESMASERKITKRYPANINEARINDLTPQTAYTFIIFASNSVGKSAGTVNFTKTSAPPVLPEPPSNLTPMNIGPYSVTLQFEPGFDGNAAIEKWIAEALTPSNGDYKPRWQNIYISTNHSQGNSIVVRNLRPFTRYKIRLTPVNVVGQSRYPSEATAEFQTSQIEPEHGPTDLSLEQVKSTSALARWSPLSNNNWSGFPHGYNLTWTEEGNTSVNYQMISDTRADSYLVKDLEEFTEYTFKIYAVNEAGSSPPSESVVITTLEDVPSSGPTNLTAHALSSTSVSVDWQAVPKRHRNGLIKGYKIQYQSDRPNAQLQYKSVEDNNTKHVTLTDLKPFTMYHLAVAAYTSLGDGVYGPIISVQTLEDAPGLPQNLSTPTISQNAARILWDPPEDTNGDILGYKVSYYAVIDPNSQSNSGSSSSKDIVTHELHHNERTFKATNLKPDTHYVFMVTAKTKEGWGQPASTLIYTYDAELRANLPFYRESWFVILCACLSVVITIIVTALLFIQTKSYKYHQDVVKSTSSQDRLGDAGFTIDEDPSGHYNNGFGLLTNGSHHRRSNGAISQSTANFTLPKTPPRPHPGSVVYSDEDGDDDVFEDHIDKPVMSVAGTSRYHSRGNGGGREDDSSADSLTEKPSEISSSTGPESESNDDEYVNMANHYANVNGTLRSQRSWRKGSAGPSSGKYASHRPKPKLPQRPAPNVPKVPGDQSLSSSDTAGTSQPMAGSSGMQAHHSRSTNGIYGDLQQNGHSSTSSQQQQQPEPNIRTLNPSQLSATTSITSNGGSSNSGTANSIGTSTKIEMQQQNTQNAEQQQLDMLNNNHIVNLNGGRIIVDNMAGSRAPLPGFTSFV